MSSSNKQSSRWKLKLGGCAAACLTASVPAGASSAAEAIDAAQAILSLRPQVSTGRAGAGEIPVQVQREEPRSRVAPVPSSRSGQPGGQPSVLPDSAGRLVRVNLSAGSTDLDCLAAAVLYEAGNQSRAGKEAVAQVVINRTRRAGYPKSVCGVVLQGSQRLTGCQFTFTCDGSMRRGHTAVGWREALDVARTALAGKVASVVGDATNYHANYVRPYWAPSLVRVAQVGAHIFYRPTGHPPAVGPAVAAPQQGRTLQPVAAGAATATVAVEQTPPRPTFSLWGLSPPSSQPAAPPTAW